MIAANVCGGAVPRQRKQPALYRVHDVPAADKVDALREFLAELRPQPPGGRSRPKDYARLLERIRERPDFGLLQTILRARCRRRSTQPEQRRPLRPRLRALRALHLADPALSRPARASRHQGCPGPRGTMSNRTGTELGRHCSETERRADDASRDVENWLKCYYMRDHVGGTFSGSITGVTPFGLFVTLDDYFVDGLVHISELGRDYFQFDAARHVLSSASAPPSASALEPTGMTGKDWCASTSRTRKIDFVPASSAPGDQMATLDKVLREGSTRSSSRVACGVVQRRTPVAHGANEPAQPRPRNSDSRARAARRSEVGHRGLPRRTRNDARARIWRSSARRAAHRVPTKRLDGFYGGGRHQGVVARVEVKNLADDLNQILEQVKNPLLLVLDGVTDPHNLGACLRVPNAAGAHAVIAPRDRAAGITPVVSKVASGAAEATPYLMVTNLARTLAEIKERNIWVVGADERAEKTLYEADLPRSIAWVLGAEGEGMRRLTRESCDLLVRSRCAAKSKA